MELITAYMYKVSPIRTDSIHKPMTMHSLRQNQWIENTRGSKKYYIFEKLFYVNNENYRVIIRFYKNKDGSLTLSTPIPFIVAKTETQDGVNFKDVKIYHGRKLKTILNMMKEGVPSILVDRVIEDLYNSIVYIDKK